MTPLEQLRSNLCETQDEIRFFSDNELLKLLMHNNENVRAASYEGLLKKAQADGVSLPDGTKTADARSYWLSLAKQYRPCLNQILQRADEEAR